MAGTTNLYPNLPGHLVEFEDGGTALRTEVAPASTDSVLLLGTAVDGPINEPVAIDMTTVEALFGKETSASGVPNGSTLVKAAKQLYETGIRDIRVMRVTGQVASTKIRKDDQSISTVETIEEDLGVALGNEEITITLKNKNLVDHSVKVFANGFPLTSGFTYNKTAGTVTLKANACNAGANIQVVYSYNKTVNVTDAEFTVNKGLKVRLPFSPAAAITVEAEELEIESQYYKVRGAEIVFTQEAGVEVGTVVKVTYNGLAKDVLNSTETGLDGVPFIAETGEQNLTLSQVPANSDVYLYADGVQLDSESYTVDEKSIVVKKELVAMGALISASYSYHSEETVSEFITIESKYGGDVYNQSSVAVRNIEATDGSIIGKEIVLVKPASKKAQATEAPLTYRSTEYATFGQLVDAINEDANNNVFKAYTDHTESLVRDLVVNVSESNSAGEYLVGGENGIGVSKVEMFEALSGKRDEQGYLVEQGAYQLLENYTCDWVVPLGVYADDKLPGRYQSFAYELGLFCSVLSYRNKMTLGVIGMTPCRDTSLAGVQKYVEKMLAYKNFYLMRDDKGNVILDGQGNPIDLGMFLSVVGGADPIYQNASSGRYAGDVAVAYAGINGVLAPQSAPTNKVLKGAKGLRFSLSNKQHNDLLGNRIVTFKTKDSNVVAVDGVTAAMPSSDYTRLSTAKVVREVVDQLREVSEPFIGQPNTIEQRNALSSALSKRLSALTGQGMLVSYEFQVIATQADQVLGQCRIELTLIPPQELRRITTVVGLRA